VKRLVLTRPVAIAGRDIWGRRVGLTLEPTEAPGWFWRVGAADIPLTPDTLVHRRQRLVLAHGAAKLHIVEHLLALRVIAGIDGVRIVSPGSWLPYDGSAEMFWHAMQPALEEGPELIPARIQGSFRAGQDRTVAYSGTEDGGLEVSVAIDYPGLGAIELQQHFPMRGAAAETIIATKAPGWPPGRRNIARAMACVSWPHLGNAVWPQEHPPATALELFARHRLLDIAGAVAVLCPPGGILAGRIVSERAGHAQDVELVRLLAAASA
jgi:UDP-3-O-acyl-N-acetylglucosamine deacetylase